MNGDGNGCAKTRCARGGEASLGTEERERPGGWTPRYWKRFSRRELALHYFYVLADDGVLEKNVKNHPPATTDRDRYTFPPDFPGERRIVRSARSFYGIRFSRLERA